MQPEKLTADYLMETDDLQELPTCNVGGRRLFYAVGPVTWNDNHQRIRNPYSNYGYYFLTENDDEPLTISQEDFLATYYPLEDDYNTLYEVDDFAWYQGGRNLYDATVLSTSTNNDYTLSSSGNTTKGAVTVVVSANQAMTVAVSLNDQSVGSITIPSNYQRRTAPPTENQSTNQYLPQEGITGGVPDPFGLSQQEIPETSEFHAEGKTQSYQQERRLQTGCRRQPLCGPFGAPRRNLGQDPNTKDRNLPT